jgi:hypothetical protein
LPASVSVHVLAGNSTFHTPRTSPKLSALLTTMYYTDVYLHVFRREARSNAKRHALVRLAKHLNHPWTHHKCSFKF